MRGCTMRAMKDSVFACAFVALAVHSSASARQTNEAVPGQAILRVEDGFTINEVILTYDAELLDVIEGGSRPRYLIGLPTTLPEQVFLQQASMDARIKDAELDFTAAAPDPGTQSFFIPSAALAYPNQPSRGHARLNRPAGLSTGVLGGAGPAVIVAVLDTGIDASHPLLADRVHPDGVSLLIGDPSIADVGDGADNDLDGLMDELVGHGTMVASAVVLAAPDARILPIRVLDSDGRSTAFRVAKGIYEAVARGARVINVSLGTTAATSTIEDAVEDALAAGVLVVASAGNDNADLARFPAAGIGVIGVAGTALGDERAPFSTFGAHVTISAPAVGFVGGLGGDWAMSSGTSFASPLVAGVAAGMLAANPSLTPEQIRMVLMATADPIDAANPGFEGLLGAGRLNGAAALESVGGAAPYIEGDLNLDTRIDVDDLNLVLSSWLNAGSAGDADYSGLVDVNDLNLILAGWGFGP